METDGPRRNLQREANDTTATDARPASQWSGPAAGLAGVVAAVPE